VLLAEEIDALFGEGGSPPAGPPPGDPGPDGEGEDPRQPELRF